MNLHGKVLSSKYIDVFGHYFPEKNDENCSIISFQNVSQQPKSIYEHKGRQTSQAFTDSNASIAMYTELSIDEYQLPEHEKFNNRMWIFNPNSVSIISSNSTIEISETPWNFIGGTSIIINKGFVLHMTSQGKGRYKTGLGRWT